MIQANELRIGNLTEQGEVKSFLENGIHVGFGICYNFNELEPIPLTEKWIFKLGFINDRVLEFYRNDFTDSTIIIDYNFICLLGYSHVKLKYVHELQNLYFALTNKELILNK